MYFDDNHFNHRLLNTYINRVGHTTLDKENLKHTEEGKYNYVYVMMFADLPILF